MKPLAVSMGDPAGIGLELAARVWADKQDAPPFFLVGDPNAFARATARLGLPTAQLNVVDDAARVTTGDALCVLRTPLAMDETPGAPDPVNADATIAAISRGVDAARVREALLGGFAYSRILENHGQRMLDRNFKPGFKAWMHQKDMNIVMQEAHRLGLMLPSSAATAQLFNAMVGSGLGEEDSIAALKLLEQLSGA